MNEDFSVNSMGQCGETKNFILNDAVRKLRTEAKGILLGRRLGTLCLYDIRTYKSVRRT